MNYFNQLKNILLNIEVTDGKRRTMPLDKAISKITGLIASLDRRTNKIIFIGNGGSASIASHISTDFLKNADVPAIAFNDASLLTCLSNDLGYEHVFEKPVEMLSSAGDILFAISSSGASTNILKAASRAMNNKCLAVTMSGFKPNNPLRGIGDINFYVPSHSYGYVEIAHLVVCHCIVDRVVEKKGRNG